MSRIAISEQVRGAFPSAITLGALACGFASLSFTASGDAAGATATIIAAMLLDSLDGRVARAVRAVSKFGAELDSLSDVVCFGAAPAFILQNWSLHKAGALGWIASLALICCCALRLARFNVSERSAAAPAWTSDWFTGVPAPAGALLSLLPVFLQRQGLFDISLSGTAMAIYVIAVALLMVSHVPTYGPKVAIRQLPRAVLFAAVALVLAAVPVLVAQPWFALSAVASAYALWLPFGWWQYEHKLRRTCP